VYSHLPQWVSAASAWRRTVEPCVPRASRHTSYTGPPTSLLLSAGCSTPLGCALKTWTFSKKCSESIMRGFQAVFQPWLDHIMAVRQPYQHFWVFWSFLIIDSMLFTFENKSSAHVLGGLSGVASFNTIDEQLQ